MVRADAPGRNVIVGAALLTQHCLNLFNSPGRVRQVNDCMAIRAFCSPYGMADYDQLVDSRTSARAMLAPRGVMTLRTPAGR
jgi:hypothetical protein